jgi:antitoxin component of MazEF toxin-antitoxin module
MLGEIKTLDKCINIVIYHYWRTYMEAVIKKWGNSLGIRIPNLIVRELSLKDGSFVDIKNIGNEIIITPKSKNKFRIILSNNQQKKEVSI